LNCSFSCLLSLLLFNASYYLYSPSTASGARYERSSCIDTDMLRHAAATFCDMGYISAQRDVGPTMRLISVEKDWKHVLI